jgi:hypothetical protein
LRGDRNDDRKDDDQNSHNSSRHIRLSVCTAVPHGRRPGARDQCARP